MGFIPIYFLFVYANTCSFVPGTSYPVLPDFYIYFKFLLLKKMVHTYRKILPLYFVYSMHQ